MKNYQKMDSLRPATPPLGITLAELQADPDAALRRIYRTWRDDFIALFARQSSLDREDLADVFQEACIALVENVRSGRLVEMTSTVKTYTFASGRKILLKRYEKLGRVALLPEFDDRLVNGLDLSHHYVIETDETSRLLREAVASLGHPCQRILTLTFYDDMRSREIAETMGYADESVVRVQRFRCIRKLRGMLKDRL